MSKGRGSSAGFTLLEVMIASSIILASIYAGTRFFSDQYSDVKGQNRRMDGRKMLLELFNESNFYPQGYPFFTINDKPMTYIYCLDEVGRQIPNKDGVVSTIGAVIEDKDAGAATDYCKQSPQCQGGGECMEIHHSWINGGKERKIELILFNKKTGISKNYFLTFVPFK